MGQTQVKAGLEIRKKAQAIVDRVSLKFSPVSELKALTYDDFLHEIQLLNEVIDELTKVEDKTVVFSIQGGTEVKFFWKVSSKIVCEKVQRINGTVISSKLLSVRRFMRLYADIMHQLSAGSTASSRRDSESSSSSHDDVNSSPFLCASLIIDGIDTTSSVHSNGDGESLADDECCICMERKCQLILSCAHGYCEECIKEWAEISTSHRIENRDSTCPLCRDPMQDASHHWVLPQSSIPPSTTEMPALVLGLVESAEGRLPAASSGNLTGTVMTSAERQQAADSADTLISSDMADGYTLVSHAPPPLPN